MELFKLGSHYVNILFFRYSEASCESLIPTPKKEDFSKFNLGQDMMETDNEDEVTIQDPKELQARNPPFNLDLDFTRYRRGKTYQSNLKVVGSNPAWDKNFFFLFFSLHLKVQCFKYRHAFQKLPKLQF